MVTSNYNQWSNTAPLLGALPAYVTGDDQNRLASYQLYEEMYWNVPDTFKVVQRGTDSDPIYIPTGRLMVETINRYFATGFNFSVRGPSPADNETVSLALQTLFRREKWFSKFNSFKRFSLVKGDALWHIIADDTKPEGRRISIHELPPDQYFPIYDVNNVENITGCHLVQVIKNEKGDDVARRQTYRKDPATGAITSEEAIYALDAWDDRNIAQEPKPPAVKLLQVITPQFTLPPLITSLPVYHMRNRWQSGQLFGSSEIRSFERIISGINQGASDEELALALDGLGVYWTTADRPDGGWTLGPGSVIEGEDTEKFERVSGVSTVTASQDHLAYLHDRGIKQPAGLSDIAIGNVDVSVAESGIALALQMAPLLSSAQEKEAELLAVHDHLFYDLTRMWLPTYEGLSAGNNVTVEPIVGDPMPQDRAAMIKEIVELVTAQLISPQYAQYLLQKDLGFEFPAEMGAQILDNIRAQAEASYADPFSERVRKELAADALEGGA